MLFLPDVAARSTPTRPSNEPDAPTLRWPAKELSRYPATPVTTYKNKYRAEPYSSSTIGPISINTHMLNPIWSNPPWRKIAVTNRHGWLMLYASGSEAPKR